MTKNQYNNIIFSSLLLSVILLLYMPFWEAVGFSITIIFLINFLYYSRTSFDIRHLILLIASTQWIFGAILSYLTVPDTNVYSMKVPPEQYFSFVVPGVIFYAAGLLFPLNYPHINKNILLQKINQIRLKSKNLDIFLIVLGLIFFAFDKLAPESLRFMIFLLSGVQFVGLLMFLTNPYRKNKNQVLIIAGIYLIISGILRGGFGLIFIWILTSYVVYNFFVDISLSKKLIFAGTALLLIFTMQGIKMQYRALTWSGGKEYSIFEKLEIFANLVEAKGEINDEETKKSVVSRINQGWIISEIIKNMEIYHAHFLNGESINRAILSVFLPGSIYKDKMKAGGQEYFTKFTGRRIGKSTSMNISVLGEAYGNYGRSGGFIFMFLFGLFLNISYLIIIKIIINNPLIVFFIPMMFQQVISTSN